MVKLNLIMVIGKSSHIDLEGKLKNLYDNRNTKAD